MNLHRRARPLLGTLVEMVVDMPDPDAAVAAMQAAFEVVARVQRAMSFHDPASELSRINRYGFHKPVTVSAHTWNALAAAQDFASRSDGLFDVTIAPRLARWGYLPNHPDLPPPTEDADWRSVQLLAGQRVALLQPVQLDLGGIGKGYAVDCAVQVLQAAGVGAGRVSAGGDNRAFGAFREQLHVRHPGQPERLLPLLPWDGAAATSAAYFSRKHRDGHAVTPLLQPHTGECCDRGRSVTVLAPDCIRADALTKIIHADPARGTALLEHYAARAFIVEADPHTDGCRVFDSATGPASLPGMMPTPLHG